MSIDNTASSEAVDDDLQAQHAQRVALVAAGIKSLHSKVLSCVG